jgi:hypothetical protein
MKKRDEMDGDAGETAGEIYGYKAKGRIAGG